MIESILSRDFFLHPAAWLAIAFAMGVVELVMPGYLFLGFATGLVRWFAFFLLALGGWAWTRDFAPAWWVICTLGVGFWLGARFLKRFTDRRVSAVVQATRERYADPG